MIGGVTAVRCAGGHSVVCSATEDDVRAWTWSNRSFMVACLVVCSTACLPVGDPPTGRQVITRRDDALAGVVPVASPDDGTVRVLVSRPRDDGTGQDLVLVTDGGGAGGPTTDLTLIERSSTTFGGHFQIDSRGRLLLSFLDDQLDDGSRKVIRVDPVTGERATLKGGGRLALSPSGDRVALSGSGASLAISLYEIDDRVTEVEGSSGLFAGEDFYFVDEVQRLQRITPHGTPEVVREGVFWFWMLPDTANGPILMLELPSLAYRPQLLFDPITLHERRLPFEAQQHWSSLSFDGRWVLGQDPDGAGWSLLDLTNGAQEHFETPVDSYETQWRPGRAELWLVAADPTQAGWIKRPATPLIDLPQRPAPFDDLEKPAPSWFTSDGAYWFSMAPFAAPGGWSILVGPSDDPAGAHVRLNPEGSTLFGYRRRADGTLLIEATYSDDRSDVIVFDPATGQARTVGRRGAVWAVGDRRVLALLDTIDRAGDLAALDLDGGGATALASDFVVGAYPERRHPDLLGAGTRVVFQFHNRFASPYDGIWVTTLP